MSIPIYVSCPFRKASASCVNCKNLQDICTRITGRVQEAGTNGFEKVIVFDSLVTVRTVSMLQDKTVYPKVVKYRKVPHVHEVTTITQDIKTHEQLPQ